MTSRTVTCETSSPPSTKHHQDSPDNVRSDGHRAVRAGWMNQGLSVPPKKETVSDNLAPCARMLLHGGLAGRLAGDTAL